MNDNMYKKYEKLFIKVKKDILITLTEKELDISTFVKELDMNLTEFSKLMSAKDIPLGTYLDILDLINSIESRRENNNESKTYRYINNEDK